MTIAGQRVLVTGASGFIGSHLCERLVQAGAEVHGLSRQPRTGATVPMRWWQGDIAAAETVRSVFREVHPHTVYHLASHVMGAPALEHVLPTFHGNLESTVNILTAAAEMGCSRLVLTGSLAEPEPLRGEAFPSSPYAAAKWASSAYARMFHALYGVPTVIARVFMVYGPAQTDLTKLIPSVILSLLNGESPAITSGDRLVDWIFVSDVIDAYLALAQAGGLEGRTRRNRFRVTRLDPRCRDACIGSRRGWDPAVLWRPARSALRAGARRRRGGDAQSHRLGPDNVPGNGPVPHGRVVSRTFRRPVEAGSGPVLPSSRWRARAAGSQVRSE